MRSLLWKDLRLNAVPLVIGAVLLVAPYAVTAFNTAREFRPASPTPFVWGNDLFAAGSYGLWFSVLTLAILGGNAIARERVDGSAAFLATLPVSRARILAAKALVIGSAGLLVWTAHLLVMYVVTRSLGFDPGLAGGLWSVVRMPLGACVVALGTSWAASAVWESPGVAMAFGAASALVVAFLAQSLGGGAPTYILAAWWIVGVGTGAAGTGAYLRRVGA